MNENRNKTERRNKWQKRELRLYLLPYNVELKKKRHSTQITEQKPRIEYAPSYSLG